MAPVTCNVSNVSAHLANNSHADDHGEGMGLYLAAWNFDFVADPFLLTLCIFVTGLLKIAFHWANLVSSVVPESGLMIVSGTIMGMVLYVAGKANDFELQPRTFILFLLPPLVLDSAYSIHDRVFAENLGTILIYAVVGSGAVFVLLGTTLYGLAAVGAMGSLQITLLDCLLFSSIICAIQPGAVFAVFGETGVNNVLYFLLFGEFLLNNAFSVLLSAQMNSFHRLGAISIEVIVRGAGAFFTGIFGGIAIGVVFGLATALITRTTSHVRVVEPLTVLTMAYLCYVCTEMVRWPGIVSTIVCGLLQAQYAFHNISSKSYTTVTYFTKMLCTTCDSVIFLFLGVDLINHNHVWSTGFILWTLLFILLYRALVIVCLTFIVNRFDRVHPIGTEEQFIMAYSGLRGAVYFALSATMHECVEHKNLFLTTAFIVIIFTVFVQGTTIKPLLSLCKIRREPAESEIMFDEMNKRVTDHLMSGIEVILGHYGTNYRRIRIFDFNDKYLRRVFQNDRRTHNQRILDVYRSMAIRDHEISVTQSKRVLDRISSEPELRLEDDILELDVDEDLPTALEIETLVIRKRYIGAAERHASRRKGFVDKMRHGGISQEVQSVEDMRKLLAQTRTGNQSLHQRYDRNLCRADQSDLVSQLAEKHNRLIRLHNFRSQSSRTAGELRPSRQNSSTRRRFHSDMLLDERVMSASDLADGPPGILQGAAARRSISVPARSQQRQLNMSTDTLNVNEFSVCEACPSIQEDTRVSIDDDIDDDQKEMKMSAATAAPNEREAAGSRSSIDAKEDAPAKDEKATDVDKLFGETPGIAGTGAPDGGVQTSEPMSAQTDGLQTGGGNAEGGERPIEDECEGECEGEGEGETESTPLLDVRSGVSASTRDEAKDPARQPLNKAAEDESTL